MRMRVQVQKQNMHSVDVFVHLIADKKCTPQIWAIDALQICAADNTKYVKVELSSTVEPV